MIEELRHRQDEKIVRHRLLAARTHALQLAVDHLALFILHQHLQLEAEPLAVVEERRHRIEVRVHDLLAMRLEIRPELVLSFGRIQEMALAHKLDEALVFRQRRNREFIAVGPEPASHQLALDPFHKSVDLHIVDIEPLHDLAHEDAFEDLAAPAVNDLAQLVKPPRLVGDDLAQDAPAPVRDDIVRHIERERIRLALRIADLVRNRRLGDTGIGVKPLAAHGEVRVRREEARVGPTDKVRHRLPFRHLVRQ